MELKEMIKHNCDMYADGMKSGYNEGVRKSIAIVIASFREWMEAPDFSINKAGSISKLIDRLKTRLLMEMEAGEVVEPTIHGHT